MMLDLILAGADIGYPEHISEICTLSQGLRCV